MDAPIRYSPDDPREWLNRARSSLRYAEARPADVYFDDACYNAQQAAEKAIKAVLIVAAVRFPYVHNLNVLLDVVEYAGFAVPSHIRAAQELTQYAERLRYPNDAGIDESAYLRALEIARRVVSWAEENVARGDRGAGAVRELPIRLYPKEPPPGEGRSPDPALLEELIARIVGAAEPDRIILFGSGARGTMRAHSDVDLLVVKSGTYDREELRSSIRDRIGGVGVAVDLVLATPADLARYGHTWALVYRPALEEGRVIYERTTP